MKEGRREREKERRKMPREKMFTRNAYARNTERKIGKEKHTKPSKW